MIGFVAKGEKQTDLKILELAEKYKPVGSTFEVMQLFVTADETKNYLRVDFEDDDRFLSDLIGGECGVEKHVRIFKKMGTWIKDGLSRLNRL